MHPYLINNEDPPSQTSQIQNNSNQQTTMKSKPSSLYNHEQNLINKTIFKTADHFYNFFSQLGNILVKVCNHPHPKTRNILLGLIILTCFCICWIVKQFLDFIGNFLKNISFMIIVQLVLSAIAIAFCFVVCYNILNRLAEKRNL